jgi:hypothetical protein
MQDAAKPARGGSIAVEKVGEQVAITVQGGPKMPGEPYARISISAEDAEKIAEDILRAVAKIRAGS